MYENLSKIKMLEGYYILLIKALLWSKQILPNWYICATISHTRQTKQQVRVSTIFIMMN